MIRIFKKFVILAVYFRAVIGKFFGTLLIFPITVLLLISERTGLLPFSVCSEILAVFPGDISRVFRRIWYKSTLKKCGTNLCVEWMAVIRCKDTVVGDNVWVGPFCWVCRALIGNNTMFGGHVRVLSGKNQHSIGRLDVPIRDQGGVHVFVEIGDDCWIGNGAIVMADISAGSIVTAGSVVNKAFPSHAIIGGVPAKIISMRES